MSVDREERKQVIEAALLTFGEPLTIARIKTVFENHDNDITESDIRELIAELQEDAQARAVHLVEVGSGFRYQARAELAPYLCKLWEEKPPRYSRALMETLALIVYRQPITRAEIEEVRGVAVSTQMIKTLEERGWVKVAGHKDVPGRPALYASTNAFLDYFSLSSLQDLPTLKDIEELDEIAKQLELVESANEHEKQLPIVVTDELLAVQAAFAIGE